MPSATVVAKILLLLGVAVSGYAEGVGAYYHEVSLREVCERRARNGWHPPAVELLCTYPCLAAAISPDPMQLGGYWLVDLPGGSLHV